MDRHLVLAHSLKHGGEAHIRQGAGAEADEDERVVVLAGQSAENFNGTIGQRDPVLAAVFDAPLRDGPHPGH